MSLKKGNMEKQLFEEQENAFYQRLGRALRLERIGQGLTQSDAGKAANCTFQQIQKYEKGSNKPGEFRVRLLVESLYKKPYDQFLKEYNVYPSSTETK